MIRFLLFATAFAGAFAAVLIPRRGVVAGVLWSVGLGAAMSLAVRAGFSPTTRRDRRLVEQSPGITTLGDGDLVAVCGTIEARAAPLRSPIYDEPSVAYQYLLYHSIPGANRGRKRVVDYSGFGIVPAVIKGQYVTAPLGAFPSLQDFGKFEFGEAPSLDKAGRYLRSARFDPVPADEMIEWVEVMDKKWDGSRTLTANFRREEGYEPTKDLFWEQRVQPGSSVCAIGVWSESSGALVGTRDHDLRLLPGTAEEVSRELGGSIGAGAWFALVLAAGSIALAAYLATRGGAAVNP